MLTQASSARKRPATAARQRPTPDAAQAPRHTRDALRPPARTHAPPNPETPTSRETPLPRDASVRHGHMPATSPTTPTARGQAPTTRPTRTMRTHIMNPLNRNSTRAPVPPPHRRPRPVRRAGRCSGRPRGQVGVPPTGLRAADASIVSTIGRRLAPHPRELTKGSRRPRPDRSRWCGRRRSISAALSGAAAQAAIDARRRRV